MVQLKLTVEKIFIVIVSILFPFSIVIAQVKVSVFHPKEVHNEVSVQSPDGSIELKFFAMNGNLNYSVNLLNNPVIELSPMKMMVDSVDLGRNINFNKHSRYKIDEQYQTRGVHSMAINKCNGISINIKKSKNIGYIFSGSTGI